MKSVVRLTIGYSPCPNDTFIFDALANNKIDTGEIKFEPVLEDVETLNQWALQGRLDVTKLSFPAFLQSIDTYILLNSGAALGNGVGPLLVSNRKVNPRENYIEVQEVVLPGLNTTANMLFTFAFPNAKNKRFVRYDQIEDELARSKEPALGAIIHENRFTYEQKGLHKVLDLGEYWEQQKQMPIPLGGIAIKRNIDSVIAGRVQQLIKNSLEWAFDHHPYISEYVRKHSQSMSEEVMRQHIDLYVNKYSLDLGDPGREAIQTLQEVFLSQQGKKETATSSRQLFLS